MEYFIENKEDEDANKRQDVNNLIFFMEKMGDYNAVTAGEENLTVDVEHGKNNEEHINNRIFFTVQ
jgi:hypothetical protein